jgi:hypothetical protein
LIKIFILKFKRWGCWFVKIRQNCFYFVGIYVILVVGCSITPLPGVDDPKSPTSTLDRPSRLNEAKSDSLLMKLLLSKCDEELFKSNNNANERNEICAQKYSMYGEYARSCLSHYLTIVKPYYKEINYSFLGSHILPSCVLRERPAGFPKQARAFHEISTEERLNYTQYDPARDFIGFVKGVPVTGR